ncbi:MULTISPECIES: snapalysin family zinc-dependent metalloprotease [Thermocrispum]|jgi:snapalysin|uniref:Extracellular small neutral protease n=1 Tax=Thermocrispum agreste TaxID=37925 RepID=A0A2W4K4B4_9PSEU|nr:MULTISPECIES: snapalysin family zinc-dependent metalloprotease [Thermocrispum]PZN01078.1 MAG: snapalysin family zinc-dependent metalloprotease [Thermocrispum agreste]
MVARTSIRTLVAAAAMILPLLATAPTATAAPAGQAPTPRAPITITYDASRAPEYYDAITRAIAIWNEHLENVQIDEADPGDDAEVTFVADPGWPRAELGPAMPGEHLTVWMGKEAVDQGHHVVRIAAHEFGHSLGLPDMKPGPCSSLMSGSTAGVDCTNAVPNAEEIALVEENYASAAQRRYADKGKILVDR